MLWESRHTTTLITFHWRPLGETAEINNIDFNLFLSMRGHGLWTFQELHDPHCAVGVGSGPGLEPSATMLAFFNLSFLRMASRGPRRSPRPS